MRNRFKRARSVLHVLGSLFEVLGLVVLLPLLVVLLFWNQYGDGPSTLFAFAAAAVFSFVLGLIMRKIFPRERLDLTAAMLTCALGWFCISAVGAIPFVISEEASCVDALFESVSGFTTTGITMFSGLDEMPRSILFWRSLTQWFGGIGILSFFLFVTSQGSSGYFMFGAESHKISTGRIAPGLTHTLRVLWGIYTILTLLAILTFHAEGMPLFDSICHSFAALSTGGFSPHDASIAYYRIAEFNNYRLIEYSMTFFMLAGGMSFLVHYRLIHGDIRSLWDSSEIRCWWQLLSFFVVVIIINHMLRSGIGDGLEDSFRNTVFQVVSILTTTGFATQDIATDYFPVLSRQLFLIMMVIGGCVGSTAGGLKVMRVVILKRLLSRELFRLRIPSTASSNVIIDNNVISSDEVHRVAALLFGWCLFLLVGGMVTALCSQLNEWESFSGMFSALGNIGPCFISAENMSSLPAAVKLVYVVGMIAGRLEILPLLLLFSRKAWA